MLTARLQNCAKMQPTSIRFYVIMMIHVAAYECLGKRRFQCTYSPKIAQSTITHFHEFLRILKPQVTNSRTMHYYTYLH